MTAHLTDRTPIIVGTLSVDGSQSAAIPPQVELAISQELDAEHMVIAASPGAAGIIALVTLPATFPRGPSL